MKVKFLSLTMEQRRERILKGNALPTILMLSLPTLMMGAVQSLIPVMDGLFLNNLVGTTAASAVTYCTPVVNMMTALAQGLSAAGMAIIGQSNGRGDFEESRRTTVQLIIFAFILGFILAPILVVAGFVLSGHVNADIAHNVLIYISLNALVIPFSFLESIYNAVKNANGKPEDSFIRMVIMLILKVLFNAIFVGLFSWGLIGSVMASLASNILITVWMFYELFVSEKGERLEFIGFHFEKEIIKKLLFIGFPSMLSNLMLNLGFFLINTEVEKYGAIILNGQGIANNITSICFILPASFGSAVTTMVSMNIGAGQPKRAKHACLVGCNVSSVTAALLIAIIVPSSSHLTVLFTRNQEVLSVANKALHIYTYSVIGFGITMVEQGAFIGLGKTRITLVMSILRVWLLRYIFILLTESYLSYYAVFWGNLFSNYGAALISTILILRVKWKSAIH